VNSGATEVAENPVLQELGSNLKESDNMDMHPNAQFPGKAVDETLLGLKVSAGLLAAFGCLSGFYGVLFGVVLGVTEVRAWRGHIYSPSNLRWFATSILIVIFTSALTWLCIRGAKALYESRRWGAYVAMVLGLLLLLFSGDFVYDMYHPERQGPDDYFGILFLPFTLLLGLWWLVYLNLPHVKVRLASMDAL
jgi:hypothetical protein